MRPASKNQTELGKLYYALPNSEKQAILEALEKVGMDRGLIYYWFRDAKNLTKMPGYIQDVFIDRIPESKALFRHKTPVPELT